MSCFRLPIQLPLFLALSWIAFDIRGLLLAPSLSTFDKECRLPDILHILLLEMPFKVEVKHVEGGIGCERLEQVGGEVDPLVVQLLVVVGALIVKPVPASYDAEVKVRDRDPHHVHEDQEHQDVPLNVLLLERSLVQPDVLKLLLKVPDEEDQLKQCVEVNHEFDA
jgi:hypothetical protein